MNNHVVNTPDLTIPINPALENGATRSPFTVSHYDLPPVVNNPPAADIHSPSVVPVVPAADIHSPAADIHSPADVHVVPAADVHVVPAAVVPVVPAAVVPVVPAAADVLVVPAADVLVVPPDPVVPVVPHAHSPAPPQPVHRQVTEIYKASVPKPPVTTISQSSSVLIQATGDTHVFTPITPTIVNPNIAIADQILSNLRHIVQLNPLDENNIISLVTDVISTVSIVKRGKEMLSGEEKRSIVIYVINQIIQEAPMSDELRMFFNVVFIPLVLPPLVNVISDFVSSDVSSDVSCSSCASCASCFPCFPCFHKGK
jgi:hypothetical protein